MARRKNSEKLYPEGYEPNITIKEDPNTRNLKELVHVVWDEQKS